MKVLGCELEKMAYTREREREREILGRMAKRKCSFSRANKREEERRERDKEKCIKRSVREEKWMQKIRILKKLITKEALLPTLALPFSVHERKKGLALPTSAECSIGKCELMYLKSD